MSSAADISNRSNAENPENQTQVKHTMEGNGDGAFVRWQSSGGRPGTRNPAPVTFTMPRNFRRNSSDTSAIRNCQKKGTGEPNHVLCIKHYQTLLMRTQNKSHLFPF